MTDPEILVKFLGFLDIKELKGGSNDLRIRNFKRPPGEGGKLFEASPELFTYLVSSCERLGEQFPGSFQFNKEAILFELPDETEVGRHFVSLLPLDKSAAVEQMKVKNEVGDVEGMSDSEKILLKLLEFLELDERGYGGRDLTLGALKYTLARGRVCWNSRLSNLVIS